MLSRTCEVKVRSLERCGYDIIEVCFAKTSSLLSRIREIKVRSFERCGYKIIKTAERYGKNMGTINYILIFLCIIAAVVATLFLIGHYRKFKVKSSKTIISEVFINHPVIIWNTDLSRVEPNECMKQVLARLDKKVGKKLILDIFDKGRDVKSYAPGALLVNALSKSGVYTEISGMNTEKAYIKWTSTVISVKNGVTLVISVGKDLTDTTLLRSELQNTKNQNRIINENLRIALESAEIGIITIKSLGFDNFSLEVSDNVRSMLAFPRYGNVTLEDFGKKVCGLSYNEYAMNIRQILNGARESINLELRMMVDKKEEHNFILKCRSKKDEYGNIERVTGALIDVSLQREKFNIFENVTYEDLLTGLPNIRGFIDKAKSYVHENRKTDMLMVMHSVRPSRALRGTSLFGREIWENLLKYFADGIIKHIKGKAIIGRVGESDFAFVSLYNNLDEVRKFAKELHIYIESGCNDVSLPKELKDYVKFDMGVCVYDGLDDAETMFNKANIMHYAKETKVNTGNDICYFYSENIEKLVYEREIIEYEIVSALKNKEYELYYQPKVSFETGEILGAEALIRWNHPKRGLILPYEFIPIAEEIGIITKIDEWGLFEACRQIRCWELKGYKPVRVSVNMSQMQFYNTDVAGDIKRAIEENQLSPDRLEIELTESIAVKNIEEAVKILDEIRKLGVVVSMDDFGTGYSQLSSLKSLPIDILKIDRSLVFDIDTNKTSRKLIKAIVEMGKALGLKVVSEGIETKMQLDILRELGCDEAQGYFYGQPVTVAEIERIFFN